MKRLAAKIIKVIVRFLPLSRQSAVSENVKWINEKILKHQEDKKEKTFYFLDFHISYKRPYELLHTYNDIFSREIYRFEADNQTPLIIDCGANIGLAILYFKTRYPNAQVLAFEPDVSNYHLLEKNILLNKLTGVSLKQAAVWTTNGLIAFSSEGSEASHIITDGSGKQLVTTIKLADVLLSKPKVDFLKIDIEGAEWSVILDCAEALKNVQNLFLEYHGSTNETYKLSDIYAVLNNVGFSVYVENVTECLHQPFFQKKTSNLYDIQLNIFCFRQ